MRKGWMRTNPGVGQEKFAPLTLAEAVFMNESGTKTLLESLNELDTQYLKKSGDTATGDFTIQADKKLTAYGVQIGIPAGDNSLINANLRNPVNQRGSSSYSTNNAYTIDRWLLSYSAAGGNLGIFSDYIRLTAPSSGYIEAIQMLDRPTKMKPGTYVVSFEVNISSGASQVIAYDRTTTLGFKDIPADASGWKKYSFTFNHAATQPYLQIHMRAYNGALLNVREIKLEYGDIATPLVPRLYELELLMCKRYYLPIGDGAWDIVFSVYGWGIIERVPIPAGMRAAPNPVYTGTLRVFDNTGWHTVTVQNILLRGGYAEITYTGYSSPMYSPIIKEGLKALDAEIY